MIGIVFHNHFIPVNGSDVEDKVFIKLTVKVNKDKVNILDITCK